MDVQLLDQIRRLCRMIVDTPYDYLEVGVYREMETLAFEISHDRDVMDGDGGCIDE